MPESWIPQLIHFLPLFLADLWPIHFLHISSVAPFLVFELSPFLCLLDLFKEPLVLDLLNYDFTVFRQKSFGFKFFSGSNRCFAILSDFLKFTLSDNLIPLGMFIKLLLFQWFMKVADLKKLLLFEFKLRDLHILPIALFEFDVEWLLFDLVLPFDLVFFSHPHPLALLVLPSLYDPLLKPALIFLFSLSLFILRTINGLLLSLVLLLDCLIG